MKKVRFGAGKFNGTGGGIEEGETPSQAAIREAREEIGVEIPEEAVEARGSIDFSFDGKPDWTRHVSIFVAREWRGEPKESEEMAPEWFALDSVPYAKMWIDDVLWLPGVLRGGSVKASFHFEGDGSKILRHDVNAY